MYRRIPGHLTFGSSKPAGASSNISLHATSCPPPTSFMQRLREFPISADKRGKVTCPGHSWPTWRLRNGVRDRNWHLGSQATSLCRLCLGGQNLISAWIPFRRDFTFSNSKIFLWLVRPMCHNLLPELEK